MKSGGSGGGAAQRSVYMFPDSSLVSIEEAWRTPNTRLLQVGDSVRPPKPKDPHKLGCVGPKEA